MKAIICGFYTFLENSVRRSVKCDVRGPDESKQFKTNTRTLALSILLVTVGVSFLTYGLPCGRLMSVCAFMHC
jgi:hypothetical protein